MKVKVRKGVYYHGLAPGAIVEVSKGEYRAMKSYFEPVDHEETDVEVPEDVSLEDLEEKSYPELKALAKILGVNAKGKKPTLIERIRESYGK